MKREITMIKVETLPNGYSLEFDGMSKKGGYMYFSPEKLLKGFMLHIGLEMTDQLNTETMDDFIVAAINWKDNKECVKEIERLTRELRLMTGKRASLARRLILERNRHIALCDAIGSLLKETKDNPEKDLRKALEKMMKEKKSMFPLTLQSLGVGENDDIEDDEEVDDE